MNSFSSFCWDCLNPHTKYGQGFYFATVISFVQGVVWAMWKDLRHG